jgi:hypothetical protein
LDEAGNASMVKQRVTVTKSLFHDPLRENHSMPVTAFQCSRLFLTAITVFASGCTATSNGETDVCNANHSFQSLDEPETHYTTCDIEACGERVSHNDVLVVQIENEEDIGRAVAEKAGADAGLNDPWYVASLAQSEKFAGVVVELSLVEPAPRVAPMSGRKQTSRRKPRSPIGPAMIQQCIHEVVGAARLRSVSRRGLLSPAGRKKRTPEE